MMHVLRSMGRRSTVIAVLLSCTVAASSCAFINVNALPQPGKSYRGGYDIVIEFANVLNLPDRAKVVLDGSSVGIVDRINISKSGVDVTARIDRAIEIPADIHAVLQQDTILGDIYVALDRTPTATGDKDLLKPNDRIPLAHTKSPPQLEDTIANLANFVASGSIQRIQNTIIGINRVTPERTERLRSMVTRVSADLSDLGDNIDTVDKWLDGVTGTVNVMTSDIPVFQSWFSPTGMRAFDIGTRTGVYLSTILPSIGSILLGGYWVVPLLESMGVAIGAVQRSKWAIEGEYRPWQRLFTNTFLPADKYPAMNIISVQTPDGRELSDNAADVLRMLGAIP
jgi:virulence factor Mce-like protein